MKCNFFGSLPDAVQGSILMVLGIILLFHTLGVLQKYLSVILVLLSIYMIIIGFIKTGGVESVKKLVAKKKKEEKEKE